MLLFAFFNIAPRKFKIIYAAGIIFFGQHWSSPLNRRKDSNSEHLNSVALCPALLGVLHSYSAV